jgi:hypothetical protein
MILKVYQPAEVEMSKTESTKPSEIPAEVPNEEERLKSKFKISRQDVLKVIRAWKHLRGIPADGPESERWNAIYYSRLVRPARDLVILFGGWETAVDCVQFVCEKMEGIGCSYTLDTVIKHADLYRETLGKWGEK